MIVAPAVPSFSVGAGLFGMPVGVEERPHRTAFGQRGHGLRQRGGILRESAIHQHDAVWAGVDNDVAARAAKQIEVFAQWCGGDFRIRALREGIAG